jgi:fatty-acyl-CoA synthase
MLGLMQEMPLLVTSLIDYAARYHSDTPILSRTLEGPILRTSWGAVHARTKQLAQALLQLGVRPGDRVATLAFNTHRHLELYYAVSGIGAVLHTVNPRLFPEQLEYIINHAEDRLLFFDLPFLPLIKALRPKLKAVQRYVLLSDAAHAPADVADLLTYEELLPPHGSDYAWPALAEGAACSLCYTSGTTGNPKGVLYSHRSTVIHALAACSADSLAVSSRDSVLLIVPMFHASGWGLPYSAAMAGASLVLPGALLDGASLCELMHLGGCNVSLGVPTVWLNFLAYLDQHPERRSSKLKRVLIGGSAAPRALVERLQNELGLEVLHLWGMTETSPVGTCASLPYRLSDLSAEEKLQIKLKQGRATYGVDLKITDDDGHELPRDGKAFGMLKVRGPWVVGRYFRDEGGDILDADGYFATGDVATLDRDGYVQITDRAKDVIKSGGEWISSIDLENAALAHPGVHEAAVIGVQHPVWQERPLLVVVRKPGAAVDPAELRALLAQKVARWWLPDDVLFVDELPHTATGKLHKLKLREQLRHYKLPPVEYKRE